MSLISGRVILAAAKLALFYIALVGLEIVVLGMALQVAVPNLRDIGAMAAMLSIPFAGAFLLLAIARRWGFVALWAILGAFWLLLTVASGAWRWGINFPQLFVPWSLFALPLWIIGQAGIPSRSSIRLRIGLVRFSTSMALLVCWAALLVGAQWFVPFRLGLPLRASGVANLLGWVWGVAPLLLSAYATRHVWRGTASPVAA
jgi:hypothetical protein